MKALELTVLLGLHGNDPALNQILKSFGKKPRFDISDHQYAYLEYKKHGICLNLKSAGATNKRAREADLIVSTLMFYAEGYEGYKGFQGDLSFDVSFSDSRKKTRKKLGEPIRAGGGGENTFFRWLLAGMGRI